MFKVQGSKLVAQTLSLKLQTTSPGHARPCKTAGILIYVSGPSMFREPRRIFRPLLSRIPSRSARTGKRAAKKARPKPCKCPKDRGPKTSSVKLKRKKAKVKSKKKSNSFTFYFYLFTFRRPVARNSLPLLTRCGRRFGEIPPAVLRVLPVKCFAAHSAPNQK